MKFKAYYFYLTHIMLHKNKVNDKIWFAFLLLWSSRSIFLYLELLYLCLNITLWEVFYVGELQVHLCKPDQNAVTCRFKFFTLANEMLLNKRKREVTMRSKQFSFFPLVISFTHLQQNPKLTKGREKTAILKIVPSTAETLH